MARGEAFMLIATYCGMCFWMGLFIGGIILLSLGAVVIIQPMSEQLRTTCEITKLEGQYFKGQCCCKGLTDPGQISQTCNCAAGEEGKLYPGAMAIVKSGAPSCPAGKNYQIAQTEAQSLCVVNATRGNPNAEMYLGKIIDPCFVECDPGYTYSFFFASATSSRRI